MFGENLLLKLRIHSRSDIFDLMYTVQTIQTVKSSVSIPPLDCY